MNLIRCNFPGCFEQIRWTSKYCPQHKLVSLTCGKCGISFERLRVMHDGIVKHSLSKIYTPSCSQKCANSTPGRKRVHTGPYRHKSQYQNIFFDLDHNERQWGVYMPMSKDIVLYNPVHYKIYDCVLLPITNAIINRVNNLEYREKARWEPPYDPIEW